MATAVVAAACSPPGTAEPEPGTAEHEPGTAEREPGTTATPSPPAGGSSPAPVTEVRIRAENRTATADTADFVATTRAVLDDARGWRRAGFRFVLDPDGPFTIVLAEGPEVDRLCRPYDTAGRYSCQNGPVVALNADRWRSATPQWTGDLPSYRTMLVNHEVGHLLHLHHPTPQCPGPGLPAPVMAQQSTELGACLPNPWPLAWEIALAGRRGEPLAPPADHDPSDHRPSPPPAAS